MRAGGPLDVFDSEMHATCGRTSEVRAPSAEPRAQGPRSERSELFAALALREGGCGVGAPLNTT